LSSPEAENEGRMSRRRLLRSVLLFSVVGMGILLEVDRLTKASPSSLPGGGSASKGSQLASYSAPVPASPSSPPLVSSSGGSSASGASVRIKAMYFQMPLAVDTKEEYFVLHGPAYFRDLLTNVVGEHPLLSSMIPTMMILIDGILAQPGTQLKDGDEVDFIPAVAGGLVDLTRD
jgi:molybdopterin converting factor small subunit